MLEVGKTYRHEHDDITNLFHIIEQCSEFYVGEATENEHKWLFDKHGNAFACFGTDVRPSFKIVPIDIEEVVYVRLNTWGDTSVSEKPNEGTAVIDIKVTLKDGIAIHAELQKANEDKTTKKLLISR